MVRLLLHVPYLLLFFTWQVLSQVPDDILVGTVPECDPATSTCAAAAHEAVRGSNSLLQEKWLRHSMVSAATANLTDQKLQEVATAFLAAAFKVSEPFSKIVEMADHAWRVIEETYPYPHKAPVVLAKDEDYLTLYDMVKVMIRDTKMLLHDARLMNPHVQSAAYAASYALFKPSDRQKYIRPEIIVNPSGPGGSSISHLGPTEPSLLDPNVDKTELEAAAWGVQALATKLESILFPLSVLYAEARPGLNAACQDAWTAGRSSTDEPYQQFAYYAEYLRMQRLESQLYKQAYWLKKTFWTVWSSTLTDGGAHEVEAEAQDKVAEKPS